MRYELRVPATADGSQEVTIGNWLKQVGDSVTIGQDLVEANTEKITLYVTSPASGKLVEILAQSGDRVAIGTLIGVVEGESG